MYAEYAAPMTTMLKGNREETKKGSKKALVWTAESDRAFEGMKQALLSAVGLHLVDPDRGFVLRTDASDYAVGAVLEQVLHDGRHVPVAFWSRVLAEGQRQTWSPREKEAYAIVMALRKWAGYIVTRSRGGPATERCGGHAQVSRQAKHYAHRGINALMSCDKAFQDPCHSATRERKYVQQHIRICTHGVKTGLG